MEIAAAVVAIVFVVAAVAFLANRRGEAGLRIPGLEVLFRRPTSQNVIKSRDTNIKKVRQSVNGEGQNSIDTKGGSLEDVTQNQKGG